MATSLALEQAEQRRWRLRPQCSGIDLFDKLLANEFLSPDEQLARQTQTLSEVIWFAVANVPHYQQLFRGLGMTAHDVQRPADLARLPMLTKRDVQEHAERLRARALPRGHEVGGMTHSSGSTGHPIQVAHTRLSLGMFNLLKQRELRWFRFDPAAKFAAIRIASELPLQPDGQPLADGMTCSLDEWPLVGRQFETGPFLGYALTNPIERKIEWLYENRPDYLMTPSSDMEHLALASQDRPRLDGLRGLFAFANQLTPGMRRRIESRFGVPVQQNYGLNEIGLVAARCPEGGQYHVHTEHCLVEIVDEQDRPCQPGQVGHVLVTGLTNPAMPLVRYDTDDLAEAVDGPCPCGRTLPSFGAVVGRYRRTAFLPPDTNKYFFTVMGTIDELPRELSRLLRQYQLHQNRDGSYELRIVSAAPLPAEFEERVQQAWRALGEAHPASLRIVEVSQIARGPGPKFHIFTTDFGIPPDRDV